MIGTKFVKDESGEMSLKRPANYNMTKSVDMGTQNTIYDDTGRNAQSMKVHRLLDKAKRVIANENKKLQREATMTDKGYGKKRT